MLSSLFIVDVIIEFIHSTYFPLKPLCASYELFTFNDCCMRFCFASLILVVMMARGVISWKKSSGLQRVCFTTSQSLSRMKCVKMCIDDRRVRQNEKESERDAIQGLRAIETILRITLITSPDNCNTHRKIRTKLQGKKLKVLRGKIPWFFLYFSPPDRELITLCCAHVHHLNGHQQFYQTGFLRIK